MYCHSLALIYLCCFFLQTNVLYHTALFIKIVHTEHKLSYILVVVVVFPVLERHWYSVQSSCRFQELLIPQVCSGDQMVTNFILKYTLENFVAY